MNKLPEMVVNYEVVDNVVRLGVLQTAFASAYLVVMGHLIEEDVLFVSAQVSPSSAAVFYSTLLETGIVLEVGSMDLRPPYSYRVYYPRDTALFGIPGAPVIVAAMQRSLRTMNAL